MKVPFIPKETVSLSVTTSSANVSLGAYAGVGSKNPQIRIYNSGSVTACIKFGVAATTAATTDMQIPPGVVEVLTLENQGAWLTWLKLATTQTSGA